GCVAPDGRGLARRRKLGQRPTAIKPVSDRFFRRLAVVVVLLADVDVVFEGILVLVLDEGDGIVLVVVAEIVVRAFAHAGVGGFGVVVVVIGRDRRRLVDGGVDLGGGDVLVLVVIVRGRLGLDLIFG